MAIYKCKMCGGTLEVQPGESIAVCDSCGSRQTLPKLDDERRVNMFERANYFRRNGDFDKAEGIFESIIVEDNTDAEAYWSLVLCKYGISYVEDPHTHKQVPTVNRAQYTPVQTDENYLSALKYADGYQRDVYEAEAIQIDSIQKGILAISQKEEPFDVFICYKDTDNAGERTKDSVIAQDIYNALIKEGYKVFFSRITLEGKLGSEYEPYIFAALNSAKVMLVVGTSKDNLESVWVKNEWSRYLSIINNNHNKVLIPVYADMNPYDMPDELSNLMAQDATKIGFMQDLIHGIEKVCSKGNATEGTSDGSATAMITPLLKRASNFLKDGDWKSAYNYCEMVLDIDSENAYAYLGKLMAELHVRKKSDISNCNTPFDKMENYQKVIQYGDDSLKEMLNKSLQAVKLRVSEKQEVKKRLKKVAIVIVTVIAVTFAIIKFGIPTYKYIGAEKLYREGKYDEALEVFMTLNGFMNSAEQRESCKTAIKDEQYNEAIQFLNDGDIISAYESLIFLDGYKDSNEKASSIYSQYNAEKLKIAKVGDKVTFGTYEQDHDSSNGKEDIEWQVLDKQGSKILVISDKALDCKPYNDEYEDITWETCTLRNWLNSDFLNAAFSSEEQTQILSTTISADENPKYNTDTGNATKDKVFLLSINEANKYFTADEDRICFPTDYAVSHGAFTSDSGTKRWWWLRSPGINQHDAADVNDSGGISFSGYRVDGSYDCVRPALWINLES